MIKTRLVILLASFSLSTAFQAKAEVHELMDLQMHVTMHQPYGFFGDGLQTASPAEVAKLTYRHQFKNVVFANLLQANAGARIIVNGAMAAEVAFSKPQATALILRQIQQINDFAKKNSNHFVVARTPQEVRWYVKHTQKTIFIHSIEGGRKLIESKTDAQFWARQGVAFITLIHLLDDEFGGAAQESTFNRVLNFPQRLHPGYNPHRGLSAHGIRTLQWLTEAGIMTDLTHMSPEAVSDSIRVFKILKLPPLVTHGLFQPVHDNERGITKEQLLDIYELGGLFSLPINGGVLTPENPEPAFVNYAKSQTICEGSADSYHLSFNYVQKFLRDNRAAIKRNSVNSELSPDALGDSIALSMGWQSDFNGWTNHSRPRYGKKGCLSSNKALPAIETKGLAHPGMLASYWQLLKNDGMDTESLKYSTEKFLRIWELFQARKK